MCECTEYETSYKTAGKKKSVKEAENTRIKWLSKLTIINTMQGFVLHFFSKLETKEISII